VLPTPSNPPEPTRDQARSLFLSTLQHIAQHAEDDKDRLAASAAGLRALAQLDTIDQRNRRLDQRDREFELAQRYLALAELREQRRRETGRPRPDEPHDSHSPSTTPNDTETQPEGFDPDYPHGPPLTPEERAALQKFLPRIEWPHADFRAANNFWRSALHDYQSGQAYQESQATGSDLPLPDGSEGRGVGSDGADTTPSPQPIERTPDLPENPSGP
jgi:hypothetical protein